jgi:putative transcriptional regulator
MIINLVSKWRTAQGLSKARLARKLGVHRSYVTKLEHGTMQPSGEMMFCIAKFLGQPLEQVFQHSQTKNEQSSFSESK